MRPNYFTNLFPRFKSIVVRKSPRQWYHRILFSEYFHPTTKIKTDKLPVSFVSTNAKRNVKCLCICDTVFIDESALSCCSSVFIFSLVWWDDICDFWLNFDCFAINKWFEGNLNVVTVCNVSEYRRPERFVWALTCGRKAFLQNCTVQDNVCNLLGCVFGRWDAERKSISCGVDVQKWTCKWISNQLEIVLLAWNL